MPDQSSTAHATTSKRQSYVPRSTQTLITGLPLTTPAVRCLLLMAWFMSDADQGVDSTPVLALALINKIDYRRTFADNRADEVRVYVSAEELVEADYRPYSQYHNVCPVVVDKEYGLHLWDEEEEGCGSNTASRVVACPWPESEDDTRLQAIRADLLAEARRNRQLQEEKERRVRASVEKTKSAAS